MDPSLGPIQNVQVLHYLVVTVNSNAVGNIAFDADDKMFFTWEVGLIKQQMIKVLTYIGGGDDTDGIDGTGTDANY